jgi:hypothetical protein
MNKPFGIILSTILMVASSQAASVDGRISTTKECTDLANSSEIQRDIMEAAMSDLTKSEGKLADDFHKFSNLDGGIKASVDDEYQTRRDAVHLLRIQYIATANQSSVATSAYLRQCVK